MYIQAGTDFVRFLFGNWDDHYYTEQNIRVSFYGYIYHHLACQGVSYFYIYEGESSEHCRMRPLNAGSDEIYKNQFVKKSFFSKKKDDQLYTASYTDLTASAEKIFDLMKKEQNCVMIIPYPLFQELLIHPVLSKVIRKLNKSSSGKNLLLVTSPVSVMKAKGLLVMEPMIECEILSKELKDKLQQDYCCPFEEWKEELSDRMIFLNELEYESIFSLVQNYFMKHFSCLEPIFQEMKWYAGIIWAWHHLDAFYYRYPSLMKEYGNPYRRNSVIEQQLGSREFRQKINRILSEWTDRENEEPVAYLISVFGSPADRHGVYLCNDESPKRYRAIDEICRLYAEDAGGLPGILSELRQLAQRYRLIREVNPMAEEYVNQYIVLMRNRLLQLQKQHCPVKEEPIGLFCQAVGYYYDRTDTEIDPILEQTQFKIAQERFVLYLHMLRLAFYGRDVRLKHELLAAEGDLSKEYRCEQLMIQAEELIDLREGEYTETVYQKMKKLSSEINSEIY